MPKVRKYYCWIRVAGVDPRLEPAPVPDGHEVSRDLEELVEEKADGSIQPKSWPKKPRMRLAGKLAKDPDVVGILQVSPDFLYKESASTRMDLGPAFLDMDEAYEWIDSVAGREWDAKAENRCLVVFNSIEMGMQP